MINGIKARRNKSEEEDGASGANENEFKYDKPPTYSKITKITKVRVSNVLINHVFE